MSSISKIIDKLPPESSESLHEMVRLGLHFSEKNPVTLLALVKLLGGKQIKDQRLNIKLGGNHNTSEILFDNPVFIGAGWDKNATSLNALLKLGAGSIEVGSVPFFQQEGNEKPRAFGLQNGVVINRYGFNSLGAKKIKRNLDIYPSEIYSKLGISIGLNKEILHKHSPYYFSLVAEQLLNYASYFVLNVSSPNTPGLRKLQEKKYLEEIIDAVQEKLETNEIRKPLFLKISPDITKHNVYEIMSTAINKNCSGIIAANTTINKSIKQKYGERWKNEDGGLSGNDKDFRKISTEFIEFIYKYSNEDFQIIGVGGINNTYTALEKLTSGANAIQVVTGIREKGLGIFNHINKGLLSILENNNIKSVQDLRGIDINEIKL